MLLRRGGVNVKVKIGITSGWEPGSIVEGWPLVYVNKGSVEGLERAGAIPVILPILDNRDLFNEYMDMVDGIIVSGEVLSIKRNVVKDGGNNPLYNSNPLRYENESAVIRTAIKKDIPLLGICRGYQVLCVELGGGMKEGDVTIGNKVIHQQGGTALPDTGVHNISIQSGTRLQNMLGTENITVNSFHRQVVETIPEGFRVSAVAPDGSIEAIETTDERFIMGLQFHPEMMRGEIWNNFFRKFVEIVTNYKQKTE